MKSRISIEELRIGMFVSRIDESWLKTPFLRHSFKIKDQEQIRKLRDAGIDSIVVDTDRGPPPDTVTSETARAKPPPVEDEPKHIPLAVGKVEAGDTLNFDLYYEVSETKRLFLAAGEIFGPDEVKALSGGDISRFYVSGLQEEALSAYIDGKRRKEKKEKAAPYSEEEFRRYSNEKEAHYTVDRGLLVPGTTPGFRLYLKSGFSIEPLVDSGNGPDYRIGASALQAVGELVIRSEDVPAYRDYLRDTLSGAGQDVKVRSRVARETAKISVKDLFDNPRSGENIKKTRNTVTGMIDIIMDRRGAFTELLTLNSYDVYSYTHSVNVAVMAISLGQSLGLSKGELLELGLGCILHDIGKSQTPHEILNKPGRLSTLELKVMQAHVVGGHEMLLQHDDIPTRAMKVVLQHHETATGRGYPYGLSGAEIKLFGKIAALIDIYDALTTDRPYKKAYSAFYALAIIGESREDFDPEIYDEFVKMLGNLV